MKIYSAIIISMFLVCCKATAQIEPPKQEGVAIEKPEQVFIPADVFETSTPISITEEAVPPPPPPPPPPPTDTEVFKVVEIMPMFPACLDLREDRKAMNECAHEAMLEYIYSNLVYPQEAIDNKVEGMCVVQFVVTKDGSIKDSKVVRDIGSGCGEAAVDVVNKMNSLPKKWISGSQRGRPVQVLYTLPVRFKLDALDENYKRGN